MTNLKLLGGYEGNGPAAARGSKVEENDQEGIFVIGFVTWGAGVDFSATRYRRVV